MDVSDEIPVYLSVTPREIMFDVPSLVYWRFLDQVRGPGALPKMSPIRTAIVEAFAPADVPKGGKWT